MPEEILTLEEIKARYDAEWVLVEDPELDKQLENIRGKVVSHSKDRDEVYRAALQLRPKRPTFLYTGRLPENTAVVL